MVGCHRPAETQAFDTHALAPNAQHRTIDVEVCRTDERSGVET